VRGIATRPVWAEVDLGAVRRNAGRLAERVAPARLCAVVKAYGYGHGPVRVAEAALAGGASWLAVALVEEGAALRRAGITEPVLLLSEPPPAAMGAVVALDLTPAVYTAPGIAAAAEAVAASGRERPLPVHLKVDTGMNRVGASPAEALALALDVTRRPELELEGLWTHLAVADEPADEFTRLQLDRFEKARAELAGEGLHPMLHAANSAAALVVPEARYDLVRCGIALYGLAPGPALEGCLPLEPALSLKARVSHVKRVDAGERISYGRRYAVTEGATVATVPIGYADGVPRRLSAVGGEVLLGGRRRPIAGTVTMDQLMVDCGDDAVAVGDEVVLLGHQGAERIGAEEWAARLDTISYEIVCGIGARVPRVFLDGPGPSGPPG
jgi:alanine racemase